MAERKAPLARRPVLDASVADLLESMEQRSAEATLPRRQREKKARERAKIESRREQRATYDLPPLLRARIKELAEQEALPASQLVTLALLRLLQDLEQNRVDLGEYKRPSRSPRYDWNLVFPDDWLPAPEKKKKKTLKSLKEES